MVVLKDYCHRKRENWLLLLSIGTQSATSNNSTQQPWHTPPPALLFREAVWLWWLHLRSPTYQQTVMCHSWLSSLTWKRLGELWGSLGWPSMRNRDFLHMFLFLSSNEWLRFGLRILSNVCKRERKGPFNLSSGLAHQSFGYILWFEQGHHSFKAWGNGLYPLLVNLSKITSLWERMGGKSKKTVYYQSALDYLIWRSFQRWFISAGFESYFKMGLFTHLFYLHLWLLHSWELHLIYCLGLGLLSTLDISQNRSILKPRQGSKETQKTFRCRLTSRDSLSRHSGWHDPLWMEGQWEQAPERWQQPSSLDSPPFLRLRLSTSHFSSEVSHLPSSSLLPCLPFLTAATSHLASSRNDYVFPSHWAQRHRRWLPP